MKKRDYLLGLSDLLDSDLSCYEYYCSLPDRFRKQLEAQDVHSFEEMQLYVEELRRCEWM